MINSHELSGLPAPKVLLPLTRGLAALDVLALPDDDDCRIFDFDPAWARNEQLATMKDDGGDEWFLLFAGESALLLGLAHEAPSFEAGCPDPRLYASLPGSLAEAVKEPAFDHLNKSFCLWWDSGMNAWQSGVEGPTDDGSAELLAIFGSTARVYAEFAEENFEVEMAVDEVQRVLDLTPMTSEIASSLNPEADLEGIRDDLSRIEYPLS